MAAWSGKKVNEVRKAAEGLNKAVLDLYETVGGARDALEAVTKYSESKAALTAAPSVPSMGGSNTSPDSQSSMFSGRPGQMDLGEGAKDLAKKISEIQRALLECCERGFKSSERPHAR